MSEKKTLLIISPLYYPARSPNVYRWDAIARHWTSQGHEIHWLCTKFSGMPEEANENGISIHRTGHHTLLDWLYGFLSIKKNRRGTLGTGMPRQSKFRKLTEKTMNWTWRKFYWPDGACLWYRPAKRKALELTKRFDFDAVISVSLPFTAARIAYAVKKENQNIFWLMDIEDPFSFVDEYFINNRGLYQARNKEAEKKALKSADMVSVTVDSARKKYIAHFPFVENKIKMTPPLYEKIRRSKKLPVGFIKDPGKIHLGYFGTFYFPIRSPEGLLKLLKKLLEFKPEMKNKIMVHFAGAIPVVYASIFDIYSESLEGMIKFYGLLSREETARMMDEMDFLVNIANTTDYHLPSKSAEYLMSRKPIINIASMEHDPFSVFINGKANLLNLILGKNTLWENSVQLFAEFINEQEHDKTVNIQEMNISEEYGLEVIAGRYEKMIFGKISSI